jgi:nucleotide-binding universal stress UspA family protein
MMESGRLRRFPSSHALVLRRVRCGTLCGTAGGNFRPLRAANLSMTEAVLKILFAVDGSEYTVKTAKYLAAHFEWFKGTPELHLLHVKLAVPPGLALAQAERLFGDQTVDTYYKEEALKALKPAEDILRAEGIAFESGYKVGDIATEIHAYATLNKMDMIAMGSHGHGALQNLLMGSVATKVLAESHLPVLIVR